MQASSRHTEALYLAANVDNCRALARKLEISLDDIPALVVFKEGKMLNSVKHISASEFDNLDYEVPANELPPDAVQTVNDSQSSGATEEL